MTLTTSSIIIPELSGKVFVIEMASVLKHSEPGEEAVAGEQQFYKLSQIKYSVSITVVSIHFM